MRDTEIKLVRGSVHEPRESQACEEQIRALYPSWGRQPVGAEGGRLRLRNARQEDLPGIVALYGRADLARFPGRGDIGARRRLAASAGAGFMLFVTPLAYQVFVAEVDEVLAGMLAVAVAHNHANGRTEAVAESLAVHADFDSDVVSGSLLCYAVKFCRQQGCATLVLSVNQGDRGLTQFLRSIEPPDS
ncbi:MAG TPA: hypothetical protein VFA75_19485 [Nevskia sp.]|nr:hypothetical protein [Nevskia sp.]